MFSKVMVHCQVSQLTHESSLTVLTKSLKTYSEHGMHSSAPGRGGGHKSG